MKMKLLVLAGVVSSFSLGTAFAQQACTATQTSTPCTMQVSSSDKNESCSNIQPGTVMSQIFGACGGAQKMGRIWANVNDTTGECAYAGPNNWQGEGALANGIPSGTTVYFYCTGN